jgi:hypothetical protein
MTSDQRSTGEEVVKAYISRSEGKTCSFFPIHLLSHLLLTYPLVGITVPAKDPLEPQQQPL